VQPVLKNVTLHNVMAGFCAVIAGFCAALTMEAGMTQTLFVAGQASLGAERAYRVHVFAVARYGVGRKFA